ncbi:WD40 repeat-like protein [Trichodelitschia bisporula]|uniref:WD40 repeat-like protein n=1 Tax=Trichodelitschia bisporula TaxID=703511 RepID=A0A6G1HVR5_9PEZI|nr:WD40 repeat-like protein [Trichodelitschia bisporula]
MTRETPTAPQPPAERTQSSLERTASHPHLALPIRAPGAAARAAVRAAADKKLRDSELSDVAGLDEMTGMVRGATGRAVDPFKLLPPELAAAIFQHLDDRSLARAAQVSRRWYRVASTPAVWRAVFLSQWMPRAPVAMGGRGIGPDITAAQQWQKMARARRAVERNWEAQKPNAIYFTGHTDSVYCAQFDERKLITGSRDRTIRVWDMQTYRCIKVIGGPQAKPKAPAEELETHPRTVVAHPSLNGTPEGDVIFHVPSDYHTASILCLQFDDDILVTGSSDSTCIVWDVKTYQPRHRLRYHSAGVLDICFDETRIISCSKDWNICVWDRATGQLLKVLAGHKGPVNAVQMRGDMLVSASGDGYSKLWDLNRMCEVRCFNSQDRGLAAVEFSDDGAYVLAGGNDQLIYKYSASTQACIARLSGHQGLVRSLYLDGANGRIISGSYDQDVRVYSFESGRELGVYSNWTTSWILAAKSDWRRIVATSQDGRAVVLDFGFGVEGVDLLRGA